jgi:hypothetical protein
MNYLGILPVVIFSLALQTQTGTVPTAGTNVDAELTKQIDVKRAKIGDVVEARISNTAKLPDGTELPKGTKVIGTVTDVRAKSKSDKTSHLAFNLNQAVTKDGHEVPLRVMVTSITAAVDAPPDISSIAGGSRQGPSVPNGPNSSPVPPSSPGGPSVTRSAIYSGMQQAAANGTVAHAPNEHVAVGNLPGVVLTSGDGTSNAGVLDAMDGNVALNPGTKLTLKVTAQK